MRRLKKYSIIDQFKIWIGENGVLTLIEDEWYDST
jgi:hypothetical protein